MLDYCMVTTLKTTRDFNKIRTSKIKKGTPAWSPLFDIRVF